MTQRIGKYRVLGEVARGGMGAVYRAKDPELGREVAIKLLLAGKGASEGQRSRFTREARALARLLHPNIMPIHDAGEHQGAPYLVMPLVEGRTLQERLEEEGPLPPGEAADLVGHVAIAVAHAHEAGVLHRDLKPENVLVLESGVPLLTDFGLARDLDLSLSGTRLSVDGQFLGTPGFWAPEQARGELRSIGPHTDVYGLGALLFALLTDRAPIVGVSLMEVLDQSSRPVVPPSRLRRGIPASLERICVRCLAADPGQRFPSAEAVVEALRRYEQGKDGARGKGLLAAAAVSVGLLLAAAIVLTAPKEGAAPVVARAPSSSARPAGPGPAASEEPPQERSSAASLAAQGRDHYEVGELGAAQRLIDQALAIDPRHREALLVRCRLLIHWTDFPEVVEIATSLPGGESDPEALEVICEAYTALRWIDRAWNAANRLIALDPGDAERYLVRARMHIDRKDLKEAGNDIEQALHLQMEGGPVRARALGLKAQLLFQQGGKNSGSSESEAAVAKHQSRYLAQEALDLDPGCWEARNAIVQLSFAEQDWETCEGVFSEAMTQRPRDPENYLRRAWLRSWSQDIDGAQADCDRAIELWPGYPMALAQRGMIWAIRYEKAVEAGAPAAEAEALLVNAKADVALAAVGGPRCAHVHRIDANVRKIAGDGAGEVAAYDRALLVEPNSVGLLRQRAMARRERARDPDGAVSDYRRALELEPNHAPTLHELAQTYRVLGGFEEALKAEREAWRSDRRPLYRLWSGIFRYELGKLNLARADVRKSLEEGLAPAHRPLAHLYLGHIDYALKRPGKALESYRAYLRDPGDYAGAKALVEERVASSERR